MIQSDTTQYVESGGAWKNLNSFKFLARRGLQSAGEAWKRETGSSFSERITIK
jgi:hypothetical protein